MRQLALHQVGLVGEAAALLRMVGGILSDFERETIVTVCRRLHDFGSEAYVSPAEWQVIGDAVDAMRTDYARALQAALGAVAAGVAQIGVRCHRALAEQRLSEPGRA